MGGHVPVGRTTATFGGFQQLLHAGSSGNFGVSPRVATGSDPSGADVRPRGVRSQALRVPGAAGSPRLRTGPVPLAQRVPGLRRESH